MPNENKTTEATQPAKILSKTETMKMMLASLEQPSGIEDKLSSEHIDKLIDQKSEIIRLVHEDRKAESWDSKFYVIIGVGVIVVILEGILFFAPEFLPETISSLVAGIGGTGFGYGLAKMRR